MDYKGLAEELVKKCLKQGADAAEVYIQSSRDLDIEVRNAEVETIKEAASQGVGIRVFSRGRMAFTYSNDLSLSSLVGQITQAIDMAATTTEDESNVLPSDQGVTEVGPLFDPEIAVISMNRKIDMAKEVEKLAMQDSRITKSAGAGFSEGEREIFIANSHGLSKNYKSSFCSLGVSVVAEKEDQKSSGGESSTCRFFQDLKSPKELADKAALDAYMMLDPRMVKTQRAAVIFDPDVARAILGGILAAINGERVLQGASFLAGKLGQKIISENITIIDDGTIPRGLSTHPFDGEGVPTQKRKIIENGVLKGFLYNTGIAKRAGTQSTGNATRGDFSRLPGIGAHSFYIAAGEKSPEEIIQSTPKGLWLKGVTGYGINPVNGNFSGGASGFWIEDGKPIFPVKGLTIASTASEMLIGIDALGSDLDLKRAMTAPTLRIANMQIGGD
jgi:PmbA protein